MACYALYLATSDGQLRAMLHNFITRWQKIQPSTDGHVLKERGVSPGPRYRQILSALRAAWLDGQVHSQTEEIALLEKLLRSDEIMPTEASPL